MPLTFVGRLEIVASWPLDGLGPTLGPPTLHDWQRPSVWPAFLPWIAILALLWVPANRGPRAWWILLPLLLIVALEWLPWADMRVTSSSVVESFAALAHGGAFGLAAIWLLAPALTRTRRIGTLAGFVGVLTVFGGATAAIGQDWEGPNAIPMVMMLVMIVLAALTLEIALIVTGRLCRRSPHPFRVLFGVLFSITAVWAVIAAIVIGIVLTQSGTAPRWEEFVIVVVVATLLTFAVLLPFLVLALASPFYRARLHGLMHLAPAAPRPTVPLPPAGVATPASGA